MHRPDGLLGDQTRLLAIRLSQQILPVLRVEEFVPDPAQNVPSFFLEKGLKRSNLSLHALDFVVRRRERTAQFRELAFQFSNSRLHVPQRCAIQDFGKGLRRTMRSQFKARPSHNQIGLST